MNTAKIAKLCNEIEDIAMEIRERTMSDSYFLAQNIIDKSRQISAEISSPTKTNADFIRQMSDEELAEFFEKNCSCPNCCIYHPASCKHIRAQCTEGYNKWLKQEVSECVTD